MALRVQFLSENVGKKFKASMENKRSRVVDASREAMNMARDEIKRRGAQDIRTAGNFGQRWVDSLTVEITPQRGRTLDLVLNVFHKIPYWTVFEFGATIRGRPLLWIPLSWTGIKIRAREYGRRYGLFRVDREGKNPLLLSIIDKKPKYVGVQSVRIRKRFHLRQIVREVARSLPTFFRRALKRGR